jgi:cyclase
VTRVWVLGLMVAIGAAGVAGAQGQSRPGAAAKDVEVRKLKDNLYLLAGGGANSLALVTELGVVLVDTKLPGWGQATLDRIRTFTNKPVTTIINTHAHEESIGGNEFFPTSVEIVAQENTRLAMDKLDRFKGVKMNFLPKLMFKEKMTLGTGKDRVDLYYFGPAHTAGDAWVVFPAQRVAHAGDLVGEKQPPAIDYENGGSGLTYPDALARAVARLTNVDTIVPSHGALLTLKDVEEYADFTRDFRNAAVSAFNHGRSISEAAEAWKIPERFRGYTAPPDRVTADVRAIFAELTR